jgi:hypothetical protein
MQALVPERREHLHCLGHTSAKQDPGREREGDDRAGEPHAFRQRAHVSGSGPRIGGHSILTPVALITFDQTSVSARIIAAPRGWNPQTCQDKLFDMSVRVS